MSGIGLDSTDITRSKVAIRKDPFTEDDESVLIELEEHTIPAASKFYIQLEEIPRSEAPSTVLIYPTSVLAEDLDDSETLIDVVDGELHEVDEVWLVDDEQMQFTGQDGNTWTVTRGYGGTSPAAHSTATRFRRLDAWTEVYTAPSVGEYQVHYPTPEIPYKGGIVRFHEDDAEKVVWVTYYGTGSGNLAEHLNDIQTRLVTETLWVLTAKINDLAVTEGKIGASAVSQAKLKTSTGSVSTSSTVGVNLTLPGGVYGFYPQVKMQAGNGIAKIGHNFTNTSYATLIHLTSDGAFVYAQQYYITASGKDPWLFILWDKQDKKILSSWYAPDHPSFGSGGDEKILPHPFADYLNKKLPDNLEIILVDLKQTKEIEKKATIKKGVCELVNEMIIDISKELKFEKRDISNEQGEHRFITKIPNYIKGRKLKKK